SCHRPSILHEAVRRPRSAQPHSVSLRLERLSLTIDQSSKLTGLPRWDEKRRIEQQRAALDRQFARGAPLRQPRSVSQSCVQLCDSATSLLRELDGRVAVHLLAAKVVRASRGASSTKSPAPALHQRLRPIEDNTNTPLVMIGHSLKQRFDSPAAVPYVLARPSVPCKDPE